jgi:uncharacterized membrane protein YwzB
METKSIHVILIIAICILAFWALRSINLWYWKIDESIENQKKIIDLLEKMNSKEEKTNL